MPHTVRCTNSTATGGHRTREAVCRECGGLFLARLSQPGRFCSRRCGLRHAMRVRDGRDVFGDRRVLFETFLEPDRTPELCWRWLGAAYPSGYTRFSPGYAHRAAYELFVGTIPAGLTIDHLCANKSCVNPTHLEVVSRGENTRRGRVRRRPDVSRLSSEQVDEIRKRYAAGGITQEQLGSDYGVTQTYISQLIRRLGCALHR
jgi:hypothetical protein